MSIIGIPIYTVLCILVKNILNRSGTFLTHCIDNVRERNTSFKIHDVKDLFLEAVHTVKPEHWVQYVDHVKKLLDEDWKKKGLDEQSVEQFVSISLTPGESDDSDSDSDIDDNELGVTPLL